MHVTDSVEPQSGAKVQLVEPTVIEFGAAETARIDRLVELRQARTGECASEARAWVLEAYKRCGFEGVERMVEG